MPPPVDLVLIFKGISGSHSKQQASEDVQSAVEEYTRLINILTNAGLKATGRKGEKQGQLMVLVWAPPRKLAQLFETQRHSDFLLGLPSSLPGHSRDFSVSPLSHADRLRLVYDYITSLTTDGGLGVVPGLTQWSHLESILALHDLDFNHSWITTWTRRRVGFNVGFAELNKIRDEFGEAVALYFAFLSSYTQALFFPSAVGLLFWILSTPYSPWYSAILTIWSIWWVEWWRVREKALSVRWGTLGSFRAEKRRPQFRTERGMSDVTEAFPWWKRELRIVSSLPIILFFAAVLAALLTCIFILEAFVTQFYQGPMHEYISLAPTVLFAALVPRVLSLYQKFACKLTNWENHDHQSSYDASLTIKTFALSAIVAHLGLVLSAFVYVPFGHLVMGSVQSYVVQVTRQGNKGSAKYLFDSDIHKAQTKIDPSRLQNQMFAYAVTNQAVDTLVEIVLPYVMRGMDNVRNGKGVSGLGSNKKKVAFEDETNGTAEERQFLDVIRRNASLPDYSLFGDYAEMITQFGYVAVWSNIWPLAPAMALFNNWLELRSDAFKIATHGRRPLPVRVDTIGPWLDTMAFISWFGALTNSALVYIFRPQDSGPFSARFGTAVDTVGKSGPTPVWHALMVPALLIALSSSHAYLLARSIMRHIIVRACWKNSDEERILRMAQDKVKGFYLKKAADEEDMNDLAISQMTQGSQAAAGQSEFWEQDEGLDELRRAFKMS